MWLTLRAAREHAFRAGWAPAYLQHLARGRRPDGSCRARLLRGLDLLLRLDAFASGPGPALLPAIGGWIRRLDADLAVPGSNPSSGNRRQGSTVRRTYFRSKSTPSSCSHPLGSEGSTHVLPFQVQPFLRQSEAGSDGSMQRAPVHVQPFLRQSSAGSETFTQRWLASRT